MLLEGGIFPIKTTKGKGFLHMLALHLLDLAKQLKILTPKHILQR